MWLYVSLCTNWFWGVNLNVQHCLVLRLLRIAEYVCFFFVWYSWYRFVSSCQTGWACLTHVHHWLHIPCLYKTLILLILRVHTFWICSHARCFFFLSSHFDCWVSTTSLALVGWLGLLNATSSIWWRCTTSTSTCWDDCIRDNICASVYQNKRKSNKNQREMKRER